MADDQKTPTKREHPKRERRDEEQPGDHPRRERQEQRPRDRNKEPVLPPWIGIGIGGGIGALEPADHNSIELASLPANIAKNRGGNEIT